MRTLTLVRHAKSDWNYPGLTDRERPLNDRGLEDAPAMGRRIAAAGIRPSLIITSPAKRAWTTARLIAGELNYPIEFLQREDDIYLASLEDLLDVVARQDASFKNLMLFGHNPGISEFANYLSPNVASSMPTAGVLAVQFTADDWTLRPSPATDRLFFDYPKNVHAGD